MRLTLEEFLEHKKEYLRPTKIVPPIKRFKLKYVCWDYRICDYTTETGRQVQLCYHLEEDGYFYFTGHEYSMLGFKRKHAQNSNKFIDLTHYNA